MGRRRLLPVTFSIDPGGNVNRGHRAAYGRWPPRATVDSFSLRAVRGDLTGANPVDRAKRGSKLHLASEGTGLPLSLLVTAANTPDASVFEALLDDIPKVRTPTGGRRCRPGKCHADKAYYNRRRRGYLTHRGIGVRIARRGVESSTVAAAAWHTAAAWANPVCLSCPNR